MIYNDDPEHYRKGTSPLAFGKGIDAMLETSKLNNFNDDNTILEVENPSDFNSKWRIWRKVQK